MACLWSDVPLDVIYLLGQRMTDKLSDIVRLGVVCRSWRSLLEDRRLPHTRALEALIGVPSLDLPKLMFADESTCILSDTLNICDWGKEHTFQLHLPEIRNRQFCGSGNGWLIISDDDMNTHLLNPVTGEQIQLPSQSSFDGYELSYVGKAIILGNPCEGGDCLVVGILPDWLVITKPSCDDSWTMLETTYMLRDIAYSRGLLYGTNSSFEFIEVWNLNTLEKVMNLWVISPIYHWNIHFYNSYIVEVSNELYGVARSLKDGVSGEGKGRSVRVVKLADDRQWVEVKDLGDCCLLLGENASTALSPVPLGSAFRRNCIYFAGRDRSVPEEKEKYEVTVYSLEEMSYQSFPFGKCDSYISNPPLWFTINPAMKKISKFF